MDESRADEVRVEGWRLSFRGHEVRTEPNASPGVILDNRTLGKAQKGSTEVHAHGGIPALTVILERTEEQRADDEGWGAEHTTAWMTHPRSCGEGLAGYSCDTVPYPDMFKHLHGRKCFE